MPSAPYLFYSIARASRPVIPPPEGAPAPRSCLARKLANFSDAVRLVNDPRSCAYHEPVEKFA